MTVLLTINGQSFNYPEPGDEEWGPDATDWATAVTNGMLQKAGGLFTLLAEVDFGATYGLKSTYFKSRSSNIAAAGALRLARADTVSWRNQANDGDLALAVNSSDVLTFDGNPIQGGVSVTDTATIDLTFVADVLSADIVSGSITNSLINASAAIDYSKLNLTGSIVNADINASAAIAVSKLAALTASRAVVTDGSGFISAATTTATEIGYVNGVTSSIQSQLDAKSGNPMTTTGDIIYASNTATPATAARLGIGAASTVLRVSGGLPSWGLLVNANVDAAAAIAYSKLALTGSIVNADISASAAIAYSKLALTGSIVNADINASAAIAYSKLALTGSIVNADINASAAIAGSKLNVTAPTYSQVGIGFHSGGFSANGSGTYTTPAGVKWIWVRMVGGGGGGGGSTTTNTSTAGTNGGNTTFGSSLLIANGGAPGNNAANSANPGAGGTSSVSSPAFGVAYIGNPGFFGNQPATFCSGAYGGASVFGGVTGQGTNQAGGAAQGSSGSGGGGGGGGNSSIYSGGGGGAGGWCEATITSPSATYAYSVGSAGSGGTGSGSNTQNGGNGGSGIIEVIEYYV